MRKEDRESRHGYSWLESRVVYMKVDLEGSKVWDSTMGFETKLLVNLSSSGWPLRFQTPHSARTFMTCYLV
ncbi:hypothetical protein PanWU01x14_351220 [Parasponia andersonii]|uniref:Uncharacterized protein n=1 Tax=Parasponia andersonii TaxID=3476 RepID=A0A2P5AAM7_PARAD|nr:hypothetical protein PanWU01x14_351220 [Parasponia andersonii]